MTILSRVLPADSIPTELASALALRLHEQAPNHAYGQLLAILADAGRRETVHRIHAMHPTQETLRALARTGDCDAEHQLLQEELATPLPTTPSHIGDDHWLANIQCATSVPLLLQRIRQAEVADTDLAYLSGLHAAFQRAARIDGLRQYRELMADPSLPGASFLWFRWAELRDHLLSAAVSWEPTHEAIQALLTALEPHSQK